MALWSAGCSSVDFVAKNGPIPQGKSIVFGNILGNKSGAVGAEIATGPGGLLYILETPLSSLAERPSISVVNRLDNETILVPLQSGAGSAFFLYLSPGRYEIFDLQEKFGFGNNIKTRIYPLHAIFSIHSEQSVVYVGTLHLTIPDLSVTDDYEEAVKEFRAQYSSVNILPIKELLQLEKRQ